MAQILIIDDEITIRESLRRLLLRDRHEIIVVENGEAAFELLRRHAVDLIIVDYLMPGMHGLEFLKKLKEQDLSIPVIMMTGHGTVRLAVEFMRNGGVDFIEKPFDFDVVRVKIKKALREKMLEEQLRAVKQLQRAAEEANRSKSAFLANLSHELRSPMHIILSFASLGKQRHATLTPEKIGSYFDRIEKSGNTLMTLLEDVITLAKLETERLPFKEESLTLMDIVATHAGQYGKEKQVPVITVQGEQKKVCVKGDRYMLGVVLDNIFENAVKFGKNMPIEVKGYTRRKKGCSTTEQVVTVTDAGMGIPPDELAGIFDPFTQSSYTDNGSGGSGLGLAICKEIIKLHKGSMWAENNFHHGSSFSFALPVNEQE